MEKIIHEDEYSKDILLPDGSVRVVRKKERKNKKRWYVRIPHSLMSGAMKDLNPTQRLTLLVLMSYEGKDGLVCPSLRTLVKQIGVNLPSTHRIIKRLGKQGYVKITKEKGKYNTYKMLF